MKKSYIFSSIILMILMGCSSPIKTITTPQSNFKKAPYVKPTPAKLNVFHQTMMKVALSTKDDTRYNKMTLDTPEKKAWFKDLMYRLWDRQITRDQFIMEGLSKYPKKLYEFTFVAQGFQRYP